VSRVRAHRNRACAAKRCVRIAAQAPTAEAREVELRFDSLNDALEQGFKVIDIREPRELEAEPLPIAHIRHIPLQQLLSSPERLDRSMRHLLVCASGKRSLAAAQELHARGHTSTYSLAGGLTGLKRRTPA
jgi:sulfur-carrier protein adenylyltransferase/sulfurtransferase